MATWETIVGATQYYAEVRPTEVVVGSRGKSVFSDDASACSHAEFLAGMLQDMVRSEHGEQTLAAMIEAVRACMRG
jgi:hypothetical protein